MENENKTKQMESELEIKLIILLVFIGVCTQLADKRKLQLIQINFGKLFKRITAQKKLYLQNQQQNKRQRSSSLSIFSGVFLNLITVKKCPSLTNLKDSLIVCKNDLVPSNFCENLLFDFCSVNTLQDLFKEYNFKKIAFLLLQLSLTFCPLAYYIKIEKKYIKSAIFASSLNFFPNFIEKLENGTKKSFRSKRKSVISRIGKYVQYQITSNTETKQTQKSFSFFKLILEKIFKKLVPKKVTFKEELKTPLENITDDKKIKNQSSLNVEKLSSRFNSFFNNVDSSSVSNIDKSVIIQQTFPTDSFKRTPILLSKKTSLNESKVEKKSEKIYFLKPCLVSNPSLIKAVSQCEQKQEEKALKIEIQQTNLVKFPSPINSKKDDKNDGYSLKEKTHKIDEFDSTNEFLSIGSSFSDKFASPQKNNWNGFNFVPEKRKFFNSKTQSGQRKLTECEKSPQLRNKITSIVSSNLNNDFFSKIDMQKTENHKPSNVEMDFEKFIENDEHKHSDKNAIESTSNIVSQTNDSLKFAKMSSTTSKVSEFKIEKMVGKNSINSAVESILCKAVAELNSELKLYSSQFFKARLFMKKSIENLLKNSFPGEFYEIREYGSFVTGLLTPFSDIDLCVVSLILVDRKDVNSFFSKFTPLLHQIPEILTVKHIDSASVPVIKITANFDQNGEKKTLQIDLTMDIREEHEDISTPFRTTEFICNCIQEFPSFLPVVLSIKYVLNLQNLSESYKGGLNAYGLSLLYLAFLHAKGFQNNLNFGKLLREFMRFLGSEFNHMTQAVCFQYCFK